MKKLLSNFLLVFFLFAFSSCAFEAGISLTKRNFRDGYYFNFFSGKNNTIKNSQETINEDKLKEQPADIPILILPENNFQRPTPSFANTRGNARHREAKKEMNQKKNFKKPFAKRNRFFEKIITKSNYPLNNNTASINHEGGGIIWTIIGILILLWLLSLLTGGWGLGGLIYLLLVVALILVILRLLEVL